MIETQQKVKGVKYKVCMKTDWVTHIDTWNITFVSNIIGPCLLHTVKYSRNNHC